MNVSMNAHLHGVHKKYVARSKKYAATEEVSSSSELSNTSNTGQVAMTKRKARAMQENRIARVEALRAQVRVGTYQVDTMLLAQCIIENESHFMESIKD